MGINNLWYTMLAGALITKRAVSGGTQEGSVE